MGPLTVFRERLLSADENFLAARNYTDCETIETSKEAAFDYRKQVQITKIFSRNVESSLTLTCQRMLHRLIFKMDGSHPIEISVITIYLLVH
jgi:hypothetical protein